VVVWAFSRDVIDVRETCSLLHMLPYESIVQVGLGGIFATSLTSFQRDDKVGQSYPNGHSRSAERHNRSRCRASRSLQASYPRISVA
jgi:hypothetical protein